MSYREAKAYERFDGATPRVSNAPEPWSGIMEMGWVYLPHSCDEWVIGDADDVLALIADLQDLLASGRVKGAGQ